MGCHTWFYRKKERNQKEAKQSCLRLLRKSEKLNLNILTDGNYKGLDWSNWTESELIKHDSYLKRQIRMVKNNFCQRAVWNHQDDKNLTEYIDGKGFYMETGFHDTFRKYGYPEDKLFSLQETLDYINNPKNDCTIYENTIERLKEFWDKYPDGMIEFG